MYDTLLEKINRTGHTDGHKNEWKVFAGTVIALALGLLAVCASL